MDCENKITIRGYVYIDENNDGQRVITEKGIKNTSVDLIKDNKVLLTYNTLDTGAYQFDVCPGNYTVKANYAQGDDSYIAQDTITASTTGDDYNFLVVKDNSVNYTDYVWLGVGILGFVILGIFTVLIKRVSTSHSL